MPKNQHHLAIMEERYILWPWITLQSALANEPVTGNSERPHFRPFPSQERHLHGGGIGERHPISSEEQHHFTRLLSSSTIISLAGIFRRASKFAIYEHCIKKCRTNCNGIQDGWLDNERRYLPLYEQCITLPSLCVATIDRDSSTKESTACLRIIEKEYTLLVSRTKQR